MAKFQDWLKKLQDYFFGQSDSSVNKQTNDLHYRSTLTKPKELPPHSTDRSITSKVTYQYSKPAKFRFPVMDDSRPASQKKREGRVKQEEKWAVKHQSTKVKANEDQIKQQEQKNTKVVYETNKNEQRIRNKRNHAPSANQKEKFNNPHFKLTQIPSPIHGFQKPVVSKEQKLTSFDHLPNEDTYRNIPGDLEKPAFRRRNEPHLRREQLNAEEINEINRETLDDFSLEDNRENLKTTLIDDSEKTFQEFENEETIPSFEWNQHELGIEEKEDSLNLVNEKEMLLKQESVLEEEKEESLTPSPKQQSIETESTERTEAHSNSEPKVAKGVQSREKTSETHTKRPIPFNVMMLPQDRKKAINQKSTEAKVQQVNQTTDKETNHKPAIQLLHNPVVAEEQDTDWMNEQAEILEETLLSFNVDAKVVHMTKGPSVTRFEIQPARGVKVTKVTSLTDDIKLALAAKDIRIEAPIPGKNTIGIEVPNRNSKPVFLREILRRGEFIHASSPLTVALGLDISGQPIVTDLKKMPHGLVAGATGSGKSVCINSMLISTIYKASPDEVKLLLIDPKMVELAPYNGLAHLVTPVITDAKQATVALKWVVSEMERRYELFSEKGVRDIGRYNDIYSEEKSKPAMPYILVVIDELADLMMVSPQEVEDAICRIAQKARACGIHLLLATQRPSVDVITGLIKANIPTRIAFSVSSQTDSRTILDMAGAERLLGKGDMLFQENGTPKPIRVQGTFVSDEEIEDVLAFSKKQRKPEYLLEIGQLEKEQQQFEHEDELFEEVCYFVIEQGSASASSIQRRYRVGYNRAARLIDMLESKGIISEAMGSKPRHVLIDESQLEGIFDMS
ncbi:DNA translocase [Bacillus sp. TS-2]|nr:DNA translocase [Bacillus sp. TS-2]